MSAMVRNWPLSGTKSQRWPVAAVSHRGISYVVHFVSRPGAALSTRSPPASIRRGTVMTLTTCTCTSDHSWSMVSTTWHSGVVSSQLFPQMFLRRSSEHKLWRIPSLRPLFFSISMCDIYLRWSQLARQSFEITFALDGTTHTLDPT